MEDNEISPRWLNFVDLYLKGHSATTSAKMAGFSDEYARVITTRMPPKVSRSLREALEAQGVTSEKLADKINALLDGDSYKAVDAGISHAVKIRGEYAPEKSVNVNLNAELLNPNIDYNKLAEAIKAYGLDTSNSKGHPDSNGDAAESVHQETPD